MWLCLCCPSPILVGTSVPSTLTAEPKVGFFPFHRRESTPSLGAHAIPASARKTFHDLDVSFMTRISMTPTTFHRVQDTNGVWRERHDEASFSSLDSTSEGSKSSIVFPTFPKNDDDDNLSQPMTPLPNVIQAEVDTQHRNGEIFEAILSALCTQAGSLPNVHVALSASLVFQICRLVARLGKDEDLPPFVLPLVLKVMRHWRAEQTRNLENLEQRARTLEDLAERFAALNLGSSQLNQARTYNQTTCMPLPSILLRTHSPVTPGQVGRSRLLVTQPPTCLNQRGSVSSTTPATTPKPSRLPFSSNAASGNRSNKAATAFNWIAEASTVQASRHSGYSPQVGQRSSRLPKLQRPPVSPSPAGVQKQSLPVSTIPFPTTSQVSGSTVEPVRERNALNTKIDSPTTSASSRKGRSAHIHHPLSPPVRGVPNPATSTRSNTSAGSFSPPNYTNKRALTMLGPESHPGKVDFPSWSPYRHSPPNEANPSMSTSSPIRSLQTRNASL